MESFFSLIYSSNNLLYISIYLSDEIKYPFLFKCPSSSYNKSLLFIFVLSILKNELDIYNKRDTKSIISGTFKYKIINSYKLFIQLFSMKSFILKIYIFPTNSTL